MKISYLDWDSIFFNLRIGAVVWDSQSSSVELEKSILSNQLDLVYIFAAHGTIGVAGKYIGTRVTYSKCIDKGKNDVHVVLADYKSNLESLYRLALISGGHSRFKVDNQFPKGAYERLYYEWMNRSIEGIIADYVYVYKENNEVIGMATLKICDNTANMGLIAVDYVHQGKGIATKLIQTIEYALSALGTIDTLSLVTQLENHNACSLYKKNGFNVVEVTDVYHFWK